MNFNLLLCMALIVSVEAGAESIAPRSILDHPAEFHGAATADLDIDGATEVRVGFFGPDDGSDPIGEAMWRGAQLALEAANASGGYNGLPFRLVARWDADPWKGGSREAVRLVYEDRVIAMIGGPDGASTHVAEQVAAKAHFVLLSPVSGDPSLTLTAVPWMFRLPPDELKQARALAVEMNRRGLARVAVVTSTDHDGRVGNDVIRKSLAAENLRPVHVTEFNTGEYDPETVAERVVSASADALVLWCPYQESRRVIASLGKRRAALTLFVPAYPVETGIEAAADKAGLVFCGAVMFEDNSNPGAAHFSESYNSRHGQRPPPAAAYAHDAMNLIIRAVRRTGVNRARVRDAIAADSGHVGVTGAIVWDNGGGNVSDVFLTAKGAKGAKDSESKQ